MFGRKKPGYYLRPRVRRTTPLMDVALAVIAGAVSGVYIFNDTLRKWQQTELMMEQERLTTGNSMISGVTSERPDKQG